MARLSSSPECPCPYTIMLPDPDVPSSKTVWKHAPMFQWLIKVIDNLLAPGLAKN